MPFAVLLHRAVGVGYGFLRVLGFTPIQVPFLPSYDISFVWDCLYLLLFSLSEYFNFYIY
jgi:hypothetical protein